MKLIVCADDFGLSRPISETIAQLAEDGKVNAISCMAVTQSWERDAGLLETLPPTVQLGLHIVLTDLVPATNMRAIAALGTLPPLRTLERLASRRQLPLTEIHAEVKAQFDRFITGTGRPPDFVDGHQHIHVLPQIRETILDAIARESPSAWVRDCTDEPGAILARPFRLKAIGSAYHSRGMAGQAALRGLGCNRGFAGHYGFAGDYGRLFPRFLSRPGPNHLVMCHPGAGRSSQDPICEARLVEAHALRHLPIGELAKEAGLSFC